MKIREYIIILTDQQDKELVRRSEAEGYDDDLEYLQLHLDSWLKSDDDIGKALAARLSHTEK